MFPPDSNVARQLAYERQARLKQDWELANAARPGLAQSRRRAWRFAFQALRLRWLRTHLRPVPRPRTG